MNILFTWKSLNCLSSAKLKPSAHQLVAESFEPSCIGAMSPSTVSFGSRICKSRAYNIIGIFFIILYFFLPSIDANEKNQGLKVSIDF